MKRVVHSGVREALGDRGAGKHGSAEEVAHHQRARG